MIELELMRLFMAAVPSALPHVRVFRREIVNATVEKNGRHYHTRAGIRGQCDLYAIVTGGRHIELECKSAKGQEAKEQSAWRILMESMKVPHLVLKAQKNEHPLLTVERWVRELAAVC